MDNEGCQSKYTLWKGAVLMCEKHLKSNPFREPGFVHAVEVAGQVFFWSDAEADK